MATGTLSTVARSLPVGGADSGGFGGLDGTRCSEQVGPSYWVGIDRGIESPKQMTCSDVV
jgi:hypothetical protein